MDKHNMDKNNAGDSGEQKALSLLVVDDEKELAQGLAEGLEYAGYTVTVAYNGEEALQQLAKHPFVALITDIHMPVMRGDELQRKARALDPDLAVLMITAAGDLATAVQCMKEGVHDYISKPFDLQDVIVRVQKALERRRMQRELRDYQANLEMRVTEQSESLRRLLLSSLQSLNSALEAKDEFTREHSERVAKVAVALAVRLDPAGTLFHSKLKLAALFHDIGKIGISESILNKPGHLLHWEMEEVKKHPVYGETILKPILPDPELLAIVRHHHEAWNGQGYPNGLKEEQIPYGARLVAVADTYDSMTSLRSFRESMPPERACRLLREGAGIQWDARIVSALLALADTGELTRLTHRSNASSAPDMYLHRTA